MTTIRHIDGHVLEEGEGSVAQVLQGAVRDGADLRGAVLSCADLTGAVLTNAKLRCADLTDADLTDADLTDADLTYADLTGADLTYADLTGADLTYADLTGADLNGADLTYADLTYADLNGANLLGTGAAMCHVAPYRVWIVPGRVGVGCVSTTVLDGTLDIAALHLEAAEDWPQVEIIVRALLDHSRREAPERWAELEGEAVTNGQ